MLVLAIMKQTGRGQVLEDATPRVTHPGVLEALPRPAAVSPVPCTDERSHAARRTGFEASRMPHRRIPTVSLPAPLSAVSGRCEAREARGAGLGSAS